MAKNSLKVYSRWLKARQKNSAQTYVNDVNQLEEHRCLNCGMVFRGNYCPICGQSGDTKRLTFREGVENLLGIFSSFDRGFLRTVSELCYRPGYMIRDYIQGHRANYIKPIQLLFLLGTLFAVAYYLFFRDVPEGDVLTLYGTKEIEELSHLINQFVLNNKPLILLAFVLFLTPLNLLFFRKSPFGQQMNLIEHFYAMVFTGCQAFMLSTIYVLVAWVFNFKLAAGNILVFSFPVFAIWDLRQLCGWGFWKSLLFGCISVLITAACLIVAIFGVAVLLLDLI